MTDFAIGSTVWPGLSKLIEETGEVQQVAGKLIATGGNIEHWDGSNLKSRLEEEIADVLASCAFVVETNGLDEKAIESRAKQKAALFAEWHYAQKVKP